MFRACSQFYRHPKIRVANFDMQTARIFAVKIRVANFEMLTTRIFVVKIRVANSEMHTTRIFVVKIRVANFEIAQLTRMKIGVANVNCKKIYINVLYEMPVILCDAL